MTQQPLIVHFIATLGFGGAERLLLEICNRMSDEFRIAVFHLKDAAPMARLFHPDVRIEKTPFTPATIRRLRHWISREKPVVIHTHFGPSDFLGLLVGAGLGIPTFSTFHSVMIKHDWRDEIIFQLYRILYNTVSRKTRVLAISSGVAQLATGKMGIHPSRVSVLYNAVPDRKQTGLARDIRKSLNIQPHDFVLIFVGRIIPLKGLMDLVSAFETVSVRIPESVLLIVGEGPQWPRIQSGIAAKGLAGKIRFVGRVDDPHPYLEASDVLVCPSHTEGFGMVVAEAFRAARPVVATRVDGLLELVVDGETGLSCPAGNPDALAARIMTLHDDPDLAHRLATAGRNAFVARFEMTRYIALLKAHYGLQP